MNKIKKPRIFLLIILLSLLSIIILYTSCYHFLARHEGVVSHSYKQFLLRHTKGQRLIIDSGSNSFFGINSNMLENELKILTINLADNAGYPLKNKLLRINNYSHKGDIVLLPLEWQYYIYEKAPDVFLNNLMGSLNFYYYDISLIDEIKRAWKTPLANFIDDINHHRKLLNKENNLKKHREKFNHGERGHYIQKNLVLTLDEGTKTLTCDQYVLGDMLKNSNTLSDVFKKDIKIISQLQKKGIRVFFTWPVVVGDNCYSENHTKVLRNFIEKIKSYLQKNGILIIGDPYENKFSQKFMLNTYYHIIPEARDIHTKLLIENIKQSKVYLWFKKNKRPQPQLDI